MEVPAAMHSRADQRLVNPAAPDSDRLLARVGAVYT